MTDQLRQFLYKNIALQNFKENQSLEFFVKIALCYGIDRETRRSK